MPEIEHGHDIGLCSVCWELVGLERSIVNDLKDGGNLFSKLSQKKGFQPSRSSCLTGNVQKL